MNKGISDFSETGISTLSFQLVLYIQVETLEVFVFN